MILYFQEPRTLQELTDEIEADPEYELRRVKPSRVNTFGAIPGEYTLSPQKEVLFVLLEQGQVHAKAIEKKRHCVCRVWT